MKNNPLSTLGRLRRALVLLLVFAGVLLAAAASAPAGTVAYWRFEEGPADAYVPHGGQPAGAFVGGTADSSGNGNWLSVWAEGWGGYAYKTDLPGPVIPQNGAANNFSVQNAGPYPVLFTEPGSAMQTWSPAAFTIEVSFKPETGGWRTLVGRDSQGAAGFDANLAALYLQITPESAVAIKFCDISGVWHEAISADGIVTGFPAGNPTAGQWYHMAAVSDGSLLSLYLNSGAGYNLVAQTDMSGSSPNTALTAGTGSGSDWVAGTWTVGRGLYAGVHVDRAYGFIDEVRISGAALPLQQFLFYQRPAILVTSAADDGPGSLRAVLAGAIDGDTISFDPGLSGATIVLTSGQIALNKNVTIDGSALASGITINGNHASRIFQVGGGVTVVLSSLTITNGIDTGGGNAGGGGILSYGTLTLNNCTLAGNSANSSWGGGGILCYHATLTINQSTLAGNSAAYYGGGVILHSGALTVNQSTVSGNVANSGGGIDNSGGTVTVNNSIVAANVGNNIAGSFTGAHNLTSGAPLLAPLGNYGGPTPTMPPLPGSPAMDGCTGGTGFTTDQRGLPRIVGPFADIGAVEAGNPIPWLLVNTALDENDGPGMNGVSLREAIAYAPSGTPILFAPALSGATILLTNGQIALGKNLIIDGSALPGGITIDGNHTDRVFYVAGGSTVFLDSLTISNGFYNGFSPGSYGGGIENLGNLTINRCTLTGNSADNSFGGAIENQGSLTLNQCTLAGNSASGGGGIASAGTLVVNQSTITGNAGTSGDGGIFAAGTTALNNSILAGNTPYDFDGGFTGAHNLTSGAPLLAPLGNYGGPTKTMPPLPGSPALNGCTGGTSFTTDQRGLPRIVGPFADIGAVESGNPIPLLLVNTAADENDGLGTNGVSLRDALAFAPPGSTIVLAPELSGATIVLTNGQLNVPNSVTILGPGPGALTVSGNHASRVFYVSGANVVLSGLTIVDGNDWAGGGIYTESGVTMAVSNCTFSGNSANYGGGICNNGDTGSATLTISASTFSGNSGNNSGGAIYNNGYAGSATLTINASTVSGNSAIAGGGIFNYGLSSATLTISASTLNNNSANFGGGIYNNGYSGSATVTIVSSTLSGNSAIGGGGIANDGAWDGSSATVRISASTLSGNSANDAGIYTDGRFNGSATLEIGDTILNAGASGANIFNFDNVGTVTSQGYNISSDNGGGYLTGTGDQTDTNPMLGPLQNNGGPTWTHALLPGSPALDQGKTNAVPGLSYSTDQRGLARLVDNPNLANATGGDGSDIGAFEGQYVLVTSIADNGPGTLREALAGASDGDTIIFSTSLPGTTILLTSGQLNVPTSVTILGPGPGALTVSGNHASRVFSVTGTNVTISGLTIADGQGALNGAGINAAGSAGSVITLSDCVVTNNSGVDGGGIYNNASVMMTISNCVISGNIAGAWGGGIYNHGESGRTALMTVIASTVSGNSAGSGAGIMNFAWSGGATLAITASTISSNVSSSYGGGIYNIGNYSGNAQLKLSSCTFSGNSATGGGAICDEGYAGTAIVEIGDTILNAGAAGGNVFIHYTGTVNSKGYNLCSDSAGGNGTAGPGGFLNATGDIRNTNPLLGPLQNNGGLTWTHALLPGSPALDKGKTNAVPGLACSTDQRGLARLVDNPYLPDATGGDGSDIGACEFQGTGGHDTDADGLPDFWELACFGHCGQCGTDDADGDGQNNHFEYIAGLNPTDPASVFSVRVEMVAGQPNQRNTVFSPWVAGRTYTPLFATDPGGTFAPLTGYSGPTTNGTEVIFTDLNANENQKFYRIQISLQ